MADRLMASLRWLLTALVIASCSAANPEPAPPVAPASEPVVTVPSVEPSPRATSDQPVVDEPPEPKTDAPELVVGTLSIEKGKQPMIAGRRFDSSVMDQFFGPAWRDLAGRRLRVRGVKHDHVCEPAAQCLAGGIIPRLNDVTSVELCEGDPPVEGIETVSCP
jgi:hypothetical protein